MTQPSIASQDVSSLAFAATPRSRSNLAGALSGAITAGAVLLASAVVSPAAGSKPARAISLPATTHDEGNGSSGEAATAPAQTTPWSVDTSVMAAEENTKPAAAVEGAKKRAAANSMRPPSEDVRRELVAAIDRADAAETVAFRRLDARGLATAFSGKALSGMSAALTGYAEQGIYRVNQLRQREIASVLVSADARRAQVRMKEVWESWLYRADTHTCRAHELAHDADQTVLLSAQPEGWRVAGITFHGAKRPTAIACR